MKDEYKNAAPFYDYILYLPLRSVRSSVCKYLQNSYENRDIKIVDFCCGTGNQLKHLKKSGFNNLTGIDISENMLKVARKDKSIKFQQADATTTNFRDAEFDVALISYALHEKPRLVSIQIMKEMKRVVKSGGEIIVADYFFDNSTSRIGKMAVTFLEWFAGKEHFQHFNSYLEHSQMEGLITDSSKKIVSRLHSRSSAIWCCFKNSNDS